MGAKRTSGAGLRAWASSIQGIVALLLLWLTACSLPPSKVRPPAILGDRVTQTGIASWYGPGFHGKATASGAIYNQNELTAAHPTLPLGTRVMVINLETGSSTEVIINDRGPYAKGRIIDLSYAAGQILGMIGPGTIPVRLEVIDGPYRIQSVRSSLDYTLQIGSFARWENAQQLRDRLVQSFPDVTIVSLQINDHTFYRVRLGTFTDRAAAIERGRQLSREGYSVIVMEK